MYCSDLSRGLGVRKRLAKNPREILFVAAPFGDIDHGAIEQLPVEYRLEIIPFKESEGGGYAGTFVSVEKRLCLRDMKGIRRRHIEEVVTSIVKRVLGLLDGGLDSSLVADAVQATKALNRENVQCLHFLERQKKRFAHSASLRKRGS